LAQVQRQRPPRYPAKKQVLTQVQVLVLVLGRALVLVGM
jgi:hypothetical protein